VVPPWFDCPPSYDRHEPSAVDNGTSTGATYSPCATQYPAPKRRSVFYTVEAFQPVDPVFYRYENDLLFLFAAVVLLLSLHIYHVSRQDATGRVPPSPGHVRST